ncbi:MULTISPECIES: HNH endonuclease [Burkholderia]|uniref:HNH endonuclease n=1 Tax=Burkholderia TaxID=32008 RepID=UPI000FDC0F50|nr:HNH endonuclease [Burkholderia thailandensis]
MMRFVHRPADEDDIPKPLAERGSDGAREREGAAKYYEVRKKKCYPFKTYKSPEVVEALEKLFHGKCAYCESKYTAVGPVDVEHFRPKGGVEEAPEHQGYWWLASDWKNLLPSCLDCNRRRRHRIATLGMTLAQLTGARRESRGKKNSFPIAGVRAFAPADDWPGEDPLLIDPTSTDPASHMAWPVDGSLSVVVPVSNHGVEDPKGAATIYTFALNRQRLVEERTRVLNAIRMQVLSLRELLEIACTINEESPRRGLIDKAVRDIAQLKQLGNASSEYSALAQAVFEVELDALVEEFRKILGEIEHRAEPEEA